MAIDTVQLIGDPLQITDGLSLLFQEFSDSLTDSAFSDVSSNDRLFLLPVSPGTFLLILPRLLSSDGLCFFLFQNSPLLPPLLILQPMRMAVKLFVTNDCFCNGAKWQPVSESNLQTRFGITNNRCAQKLDVKPWTRKKWNVRICAVLLYYFCEIWSHFDLVNVESQVTPITKQ